MWFHGRNQFKPNGFVSTANVGKTRILLIFVIVTLMGGCKGQSWNDPYPSSDKTENYYYTSFSEQPKTLDPAKSYSADEASIISQIYEPPLQYHYLLRPYTLVPLTAKSIPQPILLDRNGKPLPANAAVKDIAFSIYQIQIKPNIFYQFHPAFARKPNGEYYYHHLSTEEIKGKYTLTDFPKVGTRELTADDYVYEIKRLADPRVQSSIYGLISNYIVGMTNYNAMLTEQYNSLRKNGKNNYIDLRQFPLLGVQTIDRYTYAVTIKGYYPQFIYWLAMNFFAPVPWEADVFYSQPGMEKNNLTLGWYPIGTGPYTLAENNPNSKMVLMRNPNFHFEAYPKEGSPQDIQSGYLTLAGQKLPFVDKFIFILEKESIPRWNKFLQGYFDQSGISSESFNQAVQIDSKGQVLVTPTLKEKEIRLRTSVSPSIFYTGFNMLDPMVGGSSERARKLRLAIGMAIDTEEFISIFLNGRGIPAQGVIPPGIFGYKEGPKGIDRYIYQWENGRAVRRSLEYAKQLLVEAGYPNGINPLTGEPLLLNFDIVAGGSGDDRSYFSWLRKQFSKLGIELQIRDTQYSRFQDKVRTGQVQIFSWGWNADYPDPENFLFLFYGPNSKAKFDGENNVNYQNPVFDSLFNKMRTLPNGPERQVVIDQMQEILAHDAPLVWQFYPRAFVLSQNWVSPIKLTEISNNIYKYYKIDPQLRAQKRKQWNQPIFWPLGVGLIILFAALIPVFITYWRKQYKSPKGGSK